MLVSGLLTALGGLILSLFIERRFQEAITQLREDGILGDDRARVLAFECAWIARARRVRLLSAAGILLVVGIGYWVSYGGLPSDVELLKFWLASLLIAALVGHRLGVIGHYGRLAGALDRAGLSLHLVPGHADTAGGLAAIGNFLMFQGMLVAILIFYLTIWLILIPGYPNYVEWQGPYLAFWAVSTLFFYWGFVHPMFAFREGIRQAKRRDIEPRLARLRREIGELYAVRDAAEDDDTYFKANRALREALELRHQLAALPALPLGTVGRRLFSVTTALPFVSMGLNLLVAGNSAPRLFIDGAIKTLLEAAGG